MGGKGGRVIPPALGSPQSQSWEGRANRAKLEAVGRSRRRGEREQGPHRLTIPQGNPSREAWGA